MKRKHKWAAWLLVASMLTTSGTYAAEKPTQTEQKIQKLQIIKLPSEMKRQLDKVIRAIPELGSLQLQHAEILAEDREGPERWEFEFSDGKRWRTTASVVIDAGTGRLFSYEMENPEWESDAAPSQTVAKKAADQFLRNVLGTQAKQYRFSRFNDSETEAIEEDDEPSIAEAIYDLYINDIRVHEFHVVVRVDGDGRIISMDNYATSSVDKSKFPNPKKTISQPKAAELYKKLIDMSLTYTWVGKYEDGHAVLAYQPRFREGAIDAISGEVSKEMNNWTLQEPERFNLDAKRVPMLARSRQDAERLLTREFGISFKDMTFTDKYSDEENADDEEQQLIWYEWTSSEETDDYIRISLVTDHKTGKVIYYKYFDANLDSLDPNYTQKEAKQIAVDTLEKYVSDKKEALQLSYSYSPFERDDTPDWASEDLEDTYRPFNPNYIFRFHDVYQDAEVEFSNYLVEVEPETGKVVSLRFFDEDDLSSLPDNQDTQSPQEAADLYLKAHPLELVYVWPTYHDKKRPSPILLYVPRTHDQSYIDAFTGETITEE